MDAGVTTLAATSFVSDTPQQMRDDMQLFAEEVIPHFRAEGAPRPRSQP